MGRKIQIEVPLYILSVLWIVWLINHLLPFELGFLGILPRTFSGLKGIFFAPFIHADLNHLLANSGPFLILSTGVFTYYPRLAYRVLLFSAILGGGLTWIFARQNYHIGISGIIYSLATFLVFAGFYKKDFKSIVIALVVVFVYGGLIYGIFPGDWRISWEGHLFGAIAGFLIAKWSFKKMG